MFSVAHAAGPGSVAVMNRISMACPESPIWRNGYTMAVLSSSVIRSMTIRRPAVACTVLNCLEKSRRTSTTCW